MNEKYILCDEISFYNRGVLRNKWIKDTFVLFANGLLTRTNKEMFKDYVNLHDVIKYVKYGRDAIAYYGVPNKLPERANINFLVCVPKNLDFKKKEMWWILFTDHKRLNHWLNAMDKLNEIHNTEEHSFDDDESFVHI